MITIIGLGSVGLTTALGFCHAGFKVFGYDIDQKKVGAINDKNIPFLEPELNKKLKQHLNKNFTITNNLKEAVKRSRVIFICVGTPNNNRGETDLSYILKAIDSVLKEINKNNYKVLVIKSTVPPSITKHVLQPYIQNKGYNIGIDIGLANNPEFLREGYAWQDFIKPDRIVIGTSDNKSEKILKNIYKKFSAPIYRVSLNTGEFIKYLSNTFLSTMISYANEMSMIAYTIGDINIPLSFKILHRDKRWYGNPAKMQSYIYPGCGFGGYCLPKDTQAICSQSMQKGYTPLLLKDVLKINKNIKKFLINKIIKDVNKKKNIVLLGLAFKPKSDDVRETPSEEIIKILLKKGYKNIIAYDPVAIDNFRNSYDYPIKYIYTLSKAIKMADHLVILTAWEEFKKNKRLFKNKHIYDFRYIL